MGFVNEGGVKKVAKIKQNESNERHPHLKHYICDWCLHDYSIDDHHGHSHCLLNLIQKYRDGKTEGFSLRTKVHEACVLPSTPVQTRPFCSSVLIQRLWKFDSFGKGIPVSSDLFWCPTFGMKSCISTFLCFMCAIVANSDVWQRGDELPQLNIAILCYLVTKRFNCHFHLTFLFTHFAMLLRGS